MKVFISIEEFKEMKDYKLLHIADSSDELFVDCYNKMHLEGAHFMTIADDFQSRPIEGGAERPLPDFQKLIEKLEGYGIDLDSQVVIYTDGHLANATRTWWTLKSLGVEKVYILFDGLMGYIRKGGTTASGKEIVEEKISSSLSFNENAAVNYDELKELIDNKDIQILDVRNKPAFAKSHIANAINIPLMKVIGFDIPTRETLDKVFQELDRNKETIVYCHSGMSASTMLALLATADISARLYPGSMSDYLSREDAKLEGIITCTKKTSL